MSVPLSPGSRRRIHAARFGAELVRAMATRGVGVKPVERATGISHTNLHNFKHGINLPRLDTAQRLTEALEWPKLAEIARRARTDTCSRPRCGRTFLNEGGMPKRYCSADCRDLAAKLRRNPEPPGRGLLMAVRVELERVRSTTLPVSRRALQRACDAYGRSDAKRGVRISSFERQIETANAAVAAFCASCEPEGKCKEPACELRPVSPLPLVTEERDVATVQKPSGAWAPEHREGQLAALRAAAEKRWTPEERAAWSERMRAWHAAQPPEERADRLAKLHAGRRAPGGGTPSEERRVKTPDAIPIGEVLAQSRRMVEAARRAMTLGSGDRGQELEAVAANFGVTRRTLYRYLSIDDIHVNAVNGFEAVFATRRDGPPMQLSGWMPAVMSPSTLGSSDE